MRTFFGCEKELLECPTGNSALCSQQTVINSDFIPIFVCRKMIQNLYAAINAHPRKFLERDIAKIVFLHTAQADGALTRCWITKGMKAAVVGH